MNGAAVPRESRPPWLALAVFTLAGMAAFCALVGVTCGAVLAVAAITGVL